MKIKYFVLFNMLFNYLLLFGQQKSVEATYSDYFSLPREAVYMHLNKTTFFKGEEIWFKGYAYDQKNRLSSKATTNINVGIYDAVGNQVKKALFAAKDGVMHGNFAIDSTFSAGTYYLKAETNWMKNFRENNAFVQKIDIITDEGFAKRKSSETAQFDFQFLPEGGHMVANTQNNIGFKVIDSNGKGVKASGIVYNAQQQQVASFESNALGMGTFLLQPEQNQQYTAKITLENGAEITENMPAAKAEGIALIVKNVVDDMLIVEFNTNEKTLAKYPDKTYKILIHQNGNYKTAMLKFKNTTKAVSIEKKILFAGVNTITVFDDKQQPVVERLVFNEYGLKNANVHVSKINTINDSILVSIKELNLNDAAQVSISVLPEATQSYRPDHSIVSNFYLKPHIRGYIEKPHYYFHNMDQKKQLELDVLLLTQGWSRYDWKDIFGGKLSIRHYFENGITISGRVNFPATGIDSILLHSTKNNSAQFIKLDTDQKFELAGAFLEKDENIRFSYVSKDGDLKKPKMYLRFKVSDTDEQLSEDFLQPYYSNVDTSEFAMPKDFIYDKVEALDTIVLEAENPRLAYKDRFMADPQVTDITEKEYYYYYNVVQFLHLNGFNAVQNMGAVYISHRSARRGRPAVFLDNRLLRDPAKRILYNLSLSEIERIVIDTHSVVPVLGGKADGIIKIYTRETPLFEFNDMYLSTKTPAFFTKGKAYYAPSYASYLNPLFQKYGTIAWMPNVALHTNTPTSFKIYDTYTKNVTLFIEGISENGSLISEQKTIKVR
ncbi:MAG: hypothetical protein AAF617_02090 [Bacteroidota bacterium]